MLHRSILWCDGRTGEECREITETVGAEKLIAITANPALAGFTAGKILWVRKHLPEVYKACRHILLPKDYIRYCLTEMCIRDSMCPRSRSTCSHCPYRWSQSTPISMSTVWPLSAATTTTAV